MNLGLKLNLEVKTMYGLLALSFVAKYDTLQLASHVRTNEHRTMFVKHVRGDLISMFGMNRIPRAYKFNKTLIISFLETPWLLKEFTTVRELYSNYSRSCQNIPSRRMYD
jgi:hypothetical protein